MYCANWELPLTIEGCSRAKRVDPKQYAIFSTSHAQKRPHQSLSVPPGQQHPGSKPGMGGADSRVKPGPVQQLHAQHIQMLPQPPGTGKTLVLAGASAATAGGGDDGAGDGADDVDDGDNEDAVMRAMKANDSNRRKRARMGMVMGGPGVSHSGRPVPTQNQLEDEAKNWAQHQSIDSVLSFVSRLCKWVATQ